MIAQLIYVDICTPFRDIGISSIHNAKVKLALTTYSTVKGVNNT